MIIDARDIERFWRKTAYSASCWEHRWDLNSGGYGRHWCSYPKKRYLAHRFAWLITHGHMPTTQVLHRCDNVVCVRPDHLFVGTQTDNMIDRLMKDKQNTRRLTVEQVMAIRERRAHGALLRELAAEYRVHIGTIWCVVEQLTWHDATRVAVAASSGASGWVL